jgi:hypothetical protein
MATTFRPFGTGCTARAVLIHAGSIQKKVSGRLALEHEIDFPLAMTHTRSNTLAAPLSNWVMRLLNDVHQGQVSFLPIRL